VRINLLMATNKNHPRSIRQSKIWKTISKEIWSLNTTIDVEKELTSSNEGPKNTYWKSCHLHRHKYQEDNNQNDTDFCETTSYWKTSATDHVPRLSRRRQGWTEEGEPIDGEVGVAAALGFLEEAAGSILLVFLFLSDVTFICYKWIERF
jgi:hypothetical protein